MVEVRWAAPALRQLEEILGYISLDKPEAAAAVGRRVFDDAARLERLPFLGQKIPEFPRKQYLRLWCKPCWVYYRVEVETVFKLHVRRAERLFRMEDLPAEQSP